jgi:hypothetical protein
MSFFLTEIRRIAEDLNASSSSWCLVGGLAASVYAEPRTTKDIDIVVSIRFEQEIEALKTFLLQRGYSKPFILMHTEPTRRMGWRLITSSTRGSELPLDILSSACGIEHQIVDKSLKLEVLPGVWLPVAALGHLIAMKILSHRDISRLQDRVDLLALLTVAQRKDIELAKEALTQIMRIGYANDRNLLAELQANIDQISR